MQNILPQDILTYSFPLKVEFIPETTNKSNNHCKGTEKYSFINASFIRPSDDEDQRDEKRCRKNCTVKTLCKNKFAQRGSRSSSRATETVQKKLLTI